MTFIRSIFQPKTSVLSKLKGSDIANKQKVISELAQDTFEKTTTATKKAQPKVRPDNTIIRQTEGYTEALNSLNSSDRNLAVATVAKDFRKRVVLPFADWKDHLPEDGEAGSGVLRQMISTYTEFIESLIPTDAEKFTKLAIGADQLDMIEKVGAKNTELRVFQETIESKVGKKILDIIK